MPPIFSISVWLCQSWSFTLCEIYILVIGTNTVTTAATDDYAVESWLWIIISKMEKKNMGTKGRNIRNG